MELNTISDSKQAFYKEFPYVIPHIFRKVVDEILVELNLLSHQKDFRPDPIFAIGLTQIFQALTNGYKPIEHLEKLFESLCNCTKINPSSIKIDSQKALQISKDITLDHINKFINKEVGEIELINGENKVYNRITIVGIYTVLENIRNNNDNGKKYDKKDLTLQVAKRLGFSEDRVEKDISQYLSSIDKIKQALELISMLNKNKV